MLPISILSVRRALLSLVALSALALAVPASAAGPWLPLDIGHHWEYRGVGGLQQSETIIGTRDVLGRTVSIKAYTSGPDAGLVNFWDVAPDGAVLLCGFDNTSAGLALAYDPPIQFLAGTPVLGLDWAVQSTAYNLADMTVYATLDYRQGVLENPTLTVPAGDFPSFGVGVVLLASSKSTAPALTLDGRVLAFAGALAPLGTTNATDWYSEGVGVVQYRASDLFQLVSHGSAVPVVSTTWGALKAGYR